jgi:acyl carrier protein
MNYTKREISMALNEADVLAGLKEIVEEVAGVPAASIELGKSFTEDLDVDSLSMVEVVVAAEERFGVKIPDDQVAELATVGDAVNFIVKASA